MIFDIIRNGFSQETVMLLLARVFVVFCTLPIHEYAHARAAVALGDDTPRLKGRLTLNPMAHFDLIGGLMIFLFGFGYAKPVPVNMRNFKNRKRDMALTALAGPGSNLLMALVFLLLMHLTTLFSTRGLVLQVATYFFYYAAYINVSLAVFNLLPIPPLDGSRIFNMLIPDRFYYKLMQYERYIMIALIILLFTNILTTPLSWLTTRLFNLLNLLAGLPFPG